MAYTPISNLPTPPSRQDPANFSADADSFLGALPTFQTEVNAAGDYIDSKAVEVDADATAASASADTAQAAADSAVATVSATAWVSAASYAEGDSVWSLVNYQTYRAITAHSGETTDPSLDTTNWLALADFVKRSGDTMTGDLNVSGTINAANISDGTDTVDTGYVVNGSAKAWVSFDGTGTVAIRDSMNVSSLTDNGTGDYTVSFTNAFSTADYSVSGTSFSGNVTGPKSSTSVLAGSLQVLSWFNTFADSPIMSTSTHGDLA